MAWCGSARPFSANETNKTFETNPRLESKRGCPSACHKLVQNLRNLPLTHTLGRMLNKKVEMRPIAINGAKSFSVHITEGAQESTVAHCDTKSQALNLALAEAARLEVKVEEGT